MGLVSWLKMLTRCLEVSFSKMKLELGNTSACSISREPPTRLKGLSTLTKYHVRSLETSGRLGALNNMAQWWCKESSCVLVGLKEAVVFLLWLILVFFYTSY